MLWFKYAFSFCGEAAILGKKETSGLSGTSQTLFESNDHRRFPKL
jgi:hypothetical protein